MAYKVYRVSFNTRNLHLQKSRFRFCLLFAYLLPRFGCSKAAVSFYNLPLHTNDLVYRSPTKLAPGASDFVSEKNLFFVNISRSRALYALLFNPRVPLSPTSHTPTQKPVPHQFPDSHKTEHPSTIALLRLCRSLSS